MKRVFYIMIALVLPFCSVGAQTSVWNPDNGNGTFTNPICGETGLTPMSFE